MKLSSHIIIILSVTFLACGSSDKHVSKKSNTGDTAQTVLDTMPIQHPQPSLPPGTAKIRATVENIVTNGKDVTLHITVSQTLSYGSSTPPLSSGQTLQVNASTYKENAASKFGTLTKSEQSILTVGYSETLANQSPNWTLQRVETDSTNNKLPDGP